MTTPVHFQQRLAEELTARAATLPPTAAVPLRPRHTRRIAVTALGLAAAATAVVLIPHPAAHPAAPQAPQAGAGRSTAPVPSSSAPVLANAAYTVRSNQDGTVTVEVMNVHGLSGLQAALQKLGIPAVAMAQSASCHEPTPYGLPGLESVMSDDPSNGRLSVIRPSAIPKGETLLFAAAKAPNGGIGSLQGMLVRHVPGCYPLDDSVGGVGGSTGNP
jgi:hypothetical protein